MVAQATPVTKGDTPIADRCKTVEPLLLLFWPVQDLSLLTCFVLLKHIHSLMVPNESFSSCLSMHHAKAGMILPHLLHMDRLLVKFPAPAARPGLLFLWHCGAGSLVPQKDNLAPLSVAILKMMLSRACTGYSLW